jgi:membrane fusion protein, multidrug efflux system
VQVGDQIGDDWVINSGLAEGDPVIVDGMARIFFPGAPIRIARAPAGASAPAGGAPASESAGQAHPK